MTLTVQSEKVGLRLIGLIRSIAIGGLSGAVAGLVVFGVGGRLVMLISRLLHSDAVGRITENGNRIGEFTVEGTVELLLFGGLLSGVLGGTVWVLIRQWIPNKPAVVGLGSLAIGGFFLVQADNTDFFILGNSQLDLLLLLGLVFAFGVSIFMVERWLDKRLPNSSGTTAIVLYSIMVALGAPLVVPLFGNYLSKDFCFCANPPIWTGVFLLATALATIGWWLQHLRGAETPSKLLQAVGTTSVALATLAGGIHLTREIITIL